MFGGLLFGILLILWGISQITETIFNLHIPVFGIIFGLFLLYMGIELITGFSHWPKSCCSQCTGSQDCNSTCMSCSHIVVDNTTLNRQKSPFDYKTIMGKSFIDMTHLDPESIRATGTQLIVHVDTVFGSTHMALNKHIPTRIVVKGGFAKVTTPDDNTMAFGSHTFDSHSNEQPLLIIYSSTVFGETAITVQ